MKKRNLVDRFSFMKRIDPGVGSLLSHMWTPYNRQIVLATLVVTMAAVARAQGTMDFSGATTLMTTFNMRTAPIEEQVLLSDRIELIPEEPIAAVLRKQTLILQSIEHADHGAAVRLAQIRDEILEEPFTPILSQQFLLACGLDLTQEVTNMFDSRNDILVLTRPVHSYGSPNELSSASEVSHRGVRAGLVA